MLAPDQQNFTEVWTIDGKQYQVESNPLGQGAYGRVFKAVDRTTNEIIAIKYMSFFFMQREVDALKKLSKCDHIIRYKSSYQEKLKGGGYILTQYFPGKTLAQRISQAAQKAKEKGLKTRGLHGAIVLKITNQLMEGIQSIHKENLKHCDIKPENILVKDNGDIKIIDLGLACDVRYQNRYGTLAYYPPEHHWKEDQQKKQWPFWARDVWSCGIVIVEMLTGVNPIDKYEPFDSSSLTQMNKDLKQGIQIEYGPYYSIKWKEILSTMLQYQAHKRKPIQEIKKQLNIIAAQRIQDLKRINIDNIFTSTFMLPQSSPFKILMSESLTSKLLRDLNLFHYKYQHIPLFCKLLSQEKYPFISMYHKYLFLFLVLGFYLKSISQLFQKFQKQADKYVEKLDRNDYEYLEEVIKKYQEYYEHEVNYYRAKLKEKVIPNLKRCSPQKETPITHRQLISSMSSIYTQPLKSLIDTVDSDNYARVSRQDFLTELYNHNKDQKRPKKELKKYFYATDLAIYYLTQFFQKFDLCYQDSDIPSINIIEQIYTCLSLSQSKNDDEELRLTLLDHIKEIKKVKV